MKAVGVGGGGSFIGVEGGGGLISSSNWAWSCWASNILAEVQIVIYKLNVK